MFAYVQFRCDKAKAIVPTILIRDFFPESEIDFDKTIVHDVFWTSQEDEILAFNAYMKMATYKPEMLRAKDDKTNTKESSDGFYKANILLMKGKCMINFIQVILQFH